MTTDHSNDVAEIGKALTVETVVCQSCEQAVPNGAIYCPYCCGEDGREGAIKRGAFVGGVIGLMVGGVVAAIWSSIVGPERGTWGMVFGVTIGFVVTGLMLGMIRKRKE
jgi:hypothetical protein